MPPVRTMGRPLPAALLSSSSRTKETSQPLRLGPGPRGTGGRGGSCAAPLRSHSDEREGWSSRERRGGAGSGGRERKLCATLPQCIRSAPFCRAAEVTRSHPLAVGPSAERVPYSYPRRGGPSSRSPTRGPRERFPRERPGLRWGSCGPGPVPSPRRARNPLTPHEPREGPGAAEPRGFRATGRRVRSPQGRWEPFLASLPQSGAGAAAASRERGRARIKAPQWPPHPPLPRCGRTDEAERRARRGGGGGRGAAAAAAPAPARVRAPGRAEPGR
eukprot:XP_015140220.1 uncharacterized protein C10orf95-like [Gallus gallus]